MVNDQPHILGLLKSVLRNILVLAVVCELVLFPSLPNAYGCLMAVISYLVFSYFLKEKYIRLFPFAFCMYISIFLYRYLPLLATLFEGKPITYGFERPYQTYIFEIALFLVSSLAFYLACRKPHSELKNNFIQKFLFRSNFFNITPAILWGMGGVGFLSRLYAFSLGEIEYGNIIGKLSNGLEYLMYAPLILLFPSLIQIRKYNPKKVLIYAVFVLSLNIASNSREQMILPFGIVALLFFIYLVISGIKITNYFSPLKILLFAVSLMVIVNFLLNVSLAMLHTRQVRAEVDKKELFSQTVATLKDEALMARLKSAAAVEEEENKMVSYHTGWTEYYLDNFMMNRYANLRISDETLYYAEVRGYGNRQMQKYFMEGVLALFPTPILNLFGLRIDKNDLEFSRGDLLYGSGFGGYRVTSHIGDGLATFGYWYFLIQFLAFFFTFKLLNSMVFFANGLVLYAPYGLMNVFEFLGKFRHTNGVISDIGFIVRGFLQGVVTYLLVFYAIRFILGLISTKYITTGIQDDGSAGYPSVVR